MKNESIKNPGQISLYIYRTLCEMYLGNNYKALELANYTITMAGEGGGEMYLVRGLLYEKMNEKEKSKADYDMAKQINPLLKAFIQEA